MAGTDITSGSSTARRVGAAAGLVGITVAAAPSTPIVEAGVPSEDRCIDVIGDPGNDDSDTWDLDTWDAFLSTCQADFGFGKVIIDVVTEGGEPLPGEVDLDAITRALEFGYADDVRDAQRLRFDPYCELQWTERDESDYLFFTGGDTDFRRDDTVPGPEKLLLEILGDRDPLDGPGATDEGIDENEVLLTHHCLIADTDQLRQNPIADVGGGYQLLGGVNANYARGDFDVFGPTATIQVIVTPVPPPTTTTSTTTTTTTTTSTIPATTTTTTTSPAPTTTTASTTAAATTTTIAPAVAAPSTTGAPAAAPILPATGNRNGVMAFLAAVLLAFGGATAAVSRRRPAER